MEATEEPVWRRRNNKGRPLAERFWEKVNKNGTVPECAPHLGPCWEWMGAKTGAGYGQIKPAYRVPAAYTHRWAYEEANGPIPDGLYLDHLCRNPGCCNPAHLEAVTQKVNVRRGKVLRTHCKNGHLFTPETEMPDKRGLRRCRICNYEWQRQRRARKKAEAAGTADA